MLLVGCKPDTIIRTETVTIPSLQFVEIPPELLQCDWGVITTDMTWFHALTVLDEATAVCRSNMRAIIDLQNKVIKDE